MRVWGTGGRVWGGGGLRHEGLGYRGVGDRSHVADGQTNHVRAEPLINAINQQAAHLASSYHPRQHTWPHPTILAGPCLGLGYLLG